ncbi:MAG: hypothetical protein ACREOI_00225 [bacterium]
MKFAKWVFLIAGIYGILAVAPLYFSEAQIARDYPPAITHPEYYYGFTGVTLAWQIAFLVIASNPSRFRLMMLPAVVEKLSYVIAILFLYSQQRVVAIVIGFAAIDLILGILFMLAFLRTPKV